MKNLRIVVLYLGLLLSPAHAAVFEFGVFSPVQIMGSEADIGGLRIGMFYTENKNVSGWDMNIFVGRSTEDAAGVQLSLVNMVGNEFVGLQIGVANLNHTNKGAELAVFSCNKMAKGVRLAAFAFAEELNGGDIGVINVAKKVTGIQFGVINYATELDGIQIGVINIALNAPVPILPLFNYAF